MSTKFINRAGNATLRADPAHVIDLPIFLCPVLSRIGYHFQREFYRSTNTRSRQQSHWQARSLHSSAFYSPNAIHENPVGNIARLPQQCAGCGALSQTSQNEEPGFYSLSRKSVQAFLAGGYPIHTGRRAREQGIIKESLQNVDSKVLESLGFDKASTRTQTMESPLCDRCHKLLHHQSGVSIQHPSIESIQETIFESPHKYNHVYHVIDAADFPMSLIPRLHQLLHLTPLRSLNRRSKTGKFYHGKKNEISFVITRSDLLAPLKTQVDSLMPYLTSVLRDALGSVAREARLGNVRCVSAKRGWWTKELKEDIWGRGGGGWMVGKVNVGKSQLFESVFPKGRLGLAKFGQSPSGSHLQNQAGADTIQDSFTVPRERKEASEFSNRKGERFRGQSLNTLSLLPPLQPETDYPSMPLVSALPGTTASPIRVPFGDGKGELVDLPGLSRGDLEVYVQEPHRKSLVMRSRIRPEQQVIKPGQSLLLGGFIRITPVTPNMVFLGYAFMPIASHLTSTDKAVSIQAQERESGVQNIANPGVGAKTRSAGIFQLKWDVTKQRSGPVTNSTAAGISIDRLPYYVLSVDILIEGCGWVELVAQVRKTTSVLMIPYDTPTSAEDAPSQWPEVEVFSPDGRFIGARRPLGAWALGGQKKLVGRTKGRPRKSMKGVKKMLKGQSRMNES